MCIDNVVAAQKLAFDRFHGAHETGIVRFSRPISGSKSTLVVNLFPVSSKRKVSCAKGMNHLVPSYEGPSFSRFGSCRFAYVQLGRAEGDTPPSKGNAQVVHRAFSGREGQTMTNRTRG
jgi:hypothetical protein